MIPGGIFGGVGSQGGGGGTSSTVVYALMGQSNMVGRKGPIDTGGPDATDPDILMLSSGSLVTAADPLDHFDETADTVGPGLTFGKEVLANDAGVETVVLVPAADGGTGFIADDWRTGDPVYAAALARIEEAMTLAKALDAGATFEGFLWIQGEDDILDFSVAGDEYVAMMRQLIRDMRADVTDADADTPFVIGGLPPDWISTQSTGPDVQSEIAATPSLINKTGYADPTEPTSLDSDPGDLIHYTAASCRTMGERLYSALVSARSNTKAAPSFPAVPSGTLALHFDHAGVADGHPIYERSGLGVVVRNQRVHLVSGAMQFAQAEDVPGVLFLDNGDFSGLGSDDFSLRTTLTPANVTGLRGIIGQWHFSVDKRSWLLRSNGTILEFFFTSSGSSGGSSITWTGLAIGTEVDIEVRRVGTSLKLFVDEVERDSATLAGGFTFFASDLDTEVGIYNDDGTREFRGTMASLTLEWL